MVEGFVMTVWQNRMRLTVLQSRYRTSAAGVHRSPESLQTEARTETLELQEGVEMSLFSFNTYESSRA